jgi:hypothetical protein
MSLINSNQWPENPSVLPIKLSRAPHPTRVSEDELTTALILVTPA